jgi:hypothetical protein
VVVAIVTAFERQQIANRPSVRLSRSQPIMDLEDDGWDDGSNPVPGFVGAISTDIIRSSLLFSVRGLCACGGE